jgi:hypothetical protein
MFVMGTQILGVHLSVKSAAPQWDDWRRDEYLAFFYCAGAPIRLIEAHSLDRFQVSLNGKWRVMDSI